MEKTVVIGRSREALRIRGLTVPCLFAALVALGGYLRVPIPGNPVPLTLQVVFVLLAGAFMTPVAAAASMTLFLIVGAAGAPLFAGGGGGLAYLPGPTGGYLVGFVAGAAMCALILRGHRESYPRTILAMTGALLAIHLFGVLHLALYLGGDLRAAALFDLPFLPGDVLKLAAASAVATGASAVFAGRR